MRMSLACAALLLLSACGQTGPLYLPGPAGATSAPPAPAASAPAPAAAVSR